MRFWRWRRETDFNEEITAHIAMEVDRLVGGGMPPDEARAAARRAFGSVTGVREVFRERQRGALLEQLTQDLRYAVRTVQRSPGFAIIAVLCLAVGISVNTATFSVMNAFVLRDYPGVHGQNELVRIQIGYESKWGRTSPFYPALADYELLRTGMPAFAGVSADGRLQMAVRAVGEPRVVPGDAVSGNFFAVLGTTPAHGRFFDDRDIATDASVAVSSDAFAKETFGAPERAVGQTVTIGVRSFTIIGVAPLGFFGLRPEEVLDRQHGAPALFVPLSAAPSVRVASRGAAAETLDDTWLQIVGRLAPGATLAEARAQVEGAAARLEAFYPIGRKDAFAEVRQGWKASEELADMVAVMAVPLLILLIACANLANQLLARAVQRSREIAVRLSLGATRGRVVRQLLAESALLAGAATLLGVVFARWILDIVRAFFLSISFRIPIDGHVLAFTLAVASVACLAFGLVPALRAARRDLVGALKQGAPGSGFHGTRLRNALVVFQVAASFTLIALTGVFVRAAQQSRAAPAELPPENLLAVELDLDLLGYGDAAGRAFLASAADRLRSLPGVAAVGRAPFAPTGRVPENEIRIPGNDDARYADVAQVSGDWFSASVIPVVRGRLLTPAELAGPPTLAVVDQALEHRFWKGQDALGRTLRIGSDSSATIVTIVGVIPTRPNSEGRVPEGMIVIPGSDRYRARTVLYVRTRSNVDAMRGPVRAAVQALDPRLPMLSVRTARESRLRDFTPVRLLASGVGTLGSLALALSALGLFGVLSFMVAQRTREIGVRLALGAQRGTVTRMILKQTLTLAGIGVVIGGVAAGLLSTLMRALLYGLKPIDPIAFGTAVLVMGGVAILASLGPARRAAAVDPVTALRAD
jgi:predicted permease